jgi:hypothetical protein
MGGLFSKKSTVGCQTTTQFPVSGLATAIIGKRFAMDGNTANNVYEIKTFEYVKNQDPSVEGYIYFNSNGSPVVVAWHSSATNQIKFTSTGTGSFSRDMKLVYVDDKRIQSIDGNRITTLINV